MMTNTNTNKQVTCPKCAGKGELPHLSHIDGGLCFRCDGAGLVDPRALRAVPARHPDAERLDWRARYRNARAGLFTYEDAIDPDGMGWTPEGVASTLARLGATEAFRALGWPV